MKVNFENYDERNTLHVSAMDGSIFKKLADLYLWGNSKNLKSIEWFLRAFGKQHVTVTYECKNLVWTFVSDNCDAVVHVLVSNGGMAWEYNPIKTKTKESLNSLVDEIICALESI